MTEIVSRSGCYSDHDIKQALTVPTCFILMVKMWRVLLEVKFEFFNTIKTLPRLIGNRTCSLLRNLYIRFNRADYLCKAQW